MILGIAPKESEAHRKTLLKQSKTITLVFLMVCALPVVIYLLFYFGLIAAKARFDLALEQPVALVNTGTSTGSAFLVGETRLLTAKHVVDQLNVGDPVQLTFEKAKPPIATQAKILWIDPTSKAEPENFLNDVAVLELTNPADLPDDFPRLFLGDSDGIVSRDEVILVGYPGGLMSTTSGTISNEQIKSLELFQLDVGAWQGSSGGPLILEDTEEVVGILVAGFSADYQGINIANKINNVVSLLAGAGVDVLQ